MKIAQLSPLLESVPPTKYGGTERVVSYLTEELVTLGHEVTLFASADSETSAQLVPCASGALRPNHCADPLAYHLCMIENLLRMADDFDVIHSHVDFLAFPFFRRNNAPALTTLHGRLDLPHLKPVFEEFEEMPLVSISNAQRKPYPGLNWVGTVHHGIPQNHYRFSSERGKYLLFLGRISPEKCPDRAINLAISTGIPLYVAAKVDVSDKEYFETEIKPLLSHPLINFLGEVNDREKEQLLRGAIALVFLIDWPEPFGLVTIEAMACGTPVIATAQGSVPELIVHGENGVIVKSMKQAVAAVEIASRLSRATCRKMFEDRFTVSKMAAHYVELYHSLRAEHAGVKLAANF